MATLYAWCKYCSKVTDQLRPKNKPGILRCRHCGKERTEHADKKLRNVFGAKGRGF